VITPDVRLWLRRPDSNPIVCEIVSNKFVCEIGSDGWYPLSNYENGTWVRLVPETTTESSKVIDAPVHK
jgi:hypothetical protein